MNKLITIILILFCFESIGQNSISERLIKSYKRKNIDLYDQTLKDWSQTIQSWSSDTISNNDLLHDINDILKLLYSEENYRLIKTSSFGQYIEFQPKEGYVLFNTPDIIVKQTTSTFCFDTLEKFKNLRYNLHDSLGKSALYREQKNLYFDSLCITAIDTLINIRPQLQFSNKKLLLMTESIQKELFDFIYRKKGTTMKRWQYLYSNIYILKPYLQFIVFDYERKNCYLKYRFNDRGGYMRLKKINNLWSIIESEITWII